MRAEDLAARLDRIQSSLDALLLERRRPLIGFWEALLAAALVSAAWYFGWFGLPAFEIVHVTDGVAKTVVKSVR